VVPLPTTSASTPTDAGDIFDTLFSGGPSKAATPSGLPQMPSVQPEQLVLWFNSLCPPSASGILYEDALVAVDVAKEYRNADVRLALRIRAKDHALEEVSAKLLSTSASLLVQSRDHPTSTRARETITVDFAARCLAPFADPPTIRVSYACPSVLSAPRSVVLSLPIVSYGFTAPYRVEDSTKAQALWSNAPVGEAMFERSWRAAKLIDSSEVKTVFRKLQLFPVDTSPDTLLGIGAHSTQPAATTQFTPVLVQVTLQPGGAIVVKVKNPSTLLQNAVGEIVVSQLGGGGTAGAVASTTVSAPAPATSSMFFD